MFWLVYLYLWLQLYHTAGLQIHLVSKSCIHKTAFLLLSFKNKTCLLICLLRICPNILSAVKLSIRWLDCVWNLMAHAQKTCFFFQRNGREHLNRQGASFQTTTGSRGVRISGSNSGYTMFRGSVNSTGYPLHSPISPSLPLPCVTVCHHISTGLYNKLLFHERYE